MNSAKESLRNPIGLLVYSQPRRKALVKVTAPILRQVKIQVVSQCLSQSKENLTR